MESTNLFREPEKKFDQLPTCKVLNSTCIVRELNLPHILYLQSFSRADVISRFSTTSIILWHFVGAV